MSKSIYNIFGLHFSEFQLLSEYGLIDNSSHIEYNHFWYNNELWGFLQPDVNFHNHQKIIKILLFQDMH